MQSRLCFSHLLTCTCTRPRSRGFLALPQFICSTLVKRPNLQVVYAVSNSLEAIQQAEVLAPDLVLLDIGLSNVEWDRSSPPNSWACPEIQNSLREPGVFCGGRERSTQLWGVWLRSLKRGLNRTYLLRWMQFLRAAGLLASACRMRISLLPARQPASRFRRWLVVFP
ncbi:MAG: hypothetical protein JWQ87_919 [Candidatus Sulfotelmatobacter sp.]|nr:hypothetical protein [Candidatus Sulfotelmatobacter sp.]